VEMKLTSRFETSDKRREMDRLADVLTRERASVRSRSASKEFPSQRDAHKVSSLLVYSRNPVSPNIVNSRQPTIYGFSPANPPLVLGLLFSLTRNSMKRTICLQERSIGPHSIGGLFFKWRRTSSFSHNSRVPGWQLV
jgi:hypothetical protein